MSVLFISFAAVCFYLEEINLRNNEECKPADIW